MQDLRYALRLIARSWGFSLLVVLILALCIGANTAVLSVVNAAMLRPLAYPEPERLAEVVAVFHDAGFDNSHDGRTWEAIRDHAPAIDAAVFTDFISGVNIGVNGSGVYVRQQRVSAGFFRVLGVAPAIGREFTESEDRAGGPPAVVLSYPVWKKYFNGDTGVVGRSILLRGEPYTVAGVMPAGFRSDAPADIWTPIRPSRTGEGGGNNYGIVARLRPGASWQQASTQLSILTPDLKKQSNSYLHEADRLDMVPMLQGMTMDLHRPLMMLWAAVAFIFVLGCVNIGGMLLARASGRVGEIATRLALGAPFARIARQLLVESMVLGLLGGAAGIAVGWGGLEALRALGSGAFPFLETVKLDWRVLAATLALTLLAGVAFGMVPAWQASRVDLRTAQSGSRGIAGRKRFISLGGMVGGQVALTVPLLIGAGLLLRTFLHLWNLNPGFDPNHVLTARFSLQDARYATSQKMNQLFEKTVTRLHEMPGIEAAAVSLALPYERGLNMGVRLPGAKNEMTTMAYVTPEYFAALRIPLLQGRVFNTADGPQSAPVAVVNKAFANLYFKDQPILGQPLGLGGTRGIQVLGVVGDVQQRPGWQGYEPIAPVPAVYVPAAQTADKSLQLWHTWFSPNWIVRSSLSGPQVMAAIESATRSADPLLPMAEFRSVRDLKLDSLQPQRLLAALVGTLAILAMLLATLGIYGLIANLVAERTKELGIRMALGSSVREAVEIALRPGLVWVLVGVLSGTGIAILFERLLKSFVWGVGSTDPVTLVSVGVALLVATSLASVIPASRIARLNPADTLRSE